MHKKRILVVTRIPPISYDLDRYGLNSVDELIKLYEERKMPRWRIKHKIKRSREERDFLKELKTIFPQENIIQRDSIDRKIVSQYDLIVAVGGDNHFTYVSHFVNTTPIMGVKADQGSLGGLLYYNRDTFQKALEEIERGNFKRQKWTKLEARVNNEPVQQAMSHYMISEEKSSKYMSRFVVQLKDLGKKFKGHEEVIPGSGIIVWTGAGSTGQAKSETRYLGDKIKTFKPTDKKAMFATAVPFGRDEEIAKYKLLYGELKPGEELVLTSFCDACGVLTPDAEEDYYLKEGNEIRVRIADNPLNVVYIPCVALFNEDRWEE